MAETKDKSVQFIAKLVQLTQDKKVVWEPALVPVEDLRKLQNAAFVTSIDGKQLRIYKVKREVSLVESGIVVGPDPFKTRIVHVPILEVLDDFGQAAYSFEGRTGLDDLYESAAFSASKVGELMDSVLRID